MKRKCLFLSFVAVFLTLFLSCENAFLPVPGYEGELNRGGATAEVPLELNASQGHKREITFTWTPVAGAIRYNIYRSDAPGGDFQIIGESSSDAAMQTIMQPQGTDAWYRVAAVKYDGVKEMSHPVRGTTLAQPVITDVEGTKGNADSEIWVYWYMSNEDAYRGSVMYTVYAYDGANPSVPIAHRTVGGDTNFVTKALFDNLDPNKKYVFEVLAYNVNDQDKIEKSPKQDAETARRLRPNAPKNLKISQGDSKDTINVQFDLPVKVDVNHGTEDAPIYYEHDLFFKIYRRKLGNVGWDEICSYFGKDPSKATGSGAKVQFVSPEGTTYSDYKPEEYTVVYKDIYNASTNILERGVKYEYKVQSFQDTSIENGVSAAKNILSTSTSTDRSISYGTGWTINVPLFFTKDLNVVTNADKTEITNVSTGFGMEFETYGLYDKYKYLIVEYSQESTGGLNYTGRKNLCSSRYDLENFIYSWSKDASDPKDRVTDPVRHYVYELFIFNSSTNIDSIADKNWASSALDSVIAHGRISVGLKPGEKPVFEMFSLVSGYADKFVIKWKYNDDYIYELYYKDDSMSSFNVIRQGIDSAINEQFMRAIQGTNNGDIIEFSHSAGPGVGRTYYLRASSGVFTTDTPQLSGKTLSKPDIRQYDYDYDKVGVKWRDTTDAEKFKFNIQGVSEFEKTKSELASYKNENNEFEYIFKDAEISKSYEDATTSGLPMTLRVAAIGDVIEKKFDAAKGVINSDTPKEQAVTNVIARDARAESEINVRTLGPALTNPNVTVATSVNSINFTWDKVEGAKAYMIVRKGYWTNVDGGNFDASYYLVDVSSSQSPKIKLSKLPPDYFKNGSAEVSFSRENNAYTLKDIATEWPSEDGNGWQKAQARIKWGVPNKYFVLPLKDIGDDVDYDPNRLTEVTVGNNNVVMRNINQVERCGSAIGYGWNVKASKGVELSSDNQNQNKTVKVTWENPYINQYYTGGTVNYGVYRKKEGESKWELLSDAVTVLNREYFDKKATPGVVYEYAVGVNASNTMSNPTNDTQYMVESDKKVVEEINHRAKGEKLAAGFVLPRPIVVNVSRDGRTDENGILAEDVTWSAVHVGNKPNRMIDGYIVEVYNSNRREYKSPLGKDDIVWEELEKISFGPDKLKPTPKSNAKVKNMIREATSYTTSFNTGTDIKNKDNKLKILFDHKHWFRVRAYTDDAETGIITVSDEYKPSDAVWDYWRPDDGEGSSGYKWGTRGMTHEEFKYAACWLLAQGVNKVGWQSTLSWWNAGDGFYSKSTWGVGGWGFVYYDFGTNSFLRADGRLLAETTGAGKKPRYYSTLMGDCSGHDSAHQTLWYIAGGGGWPKPGELRGNPGIDGTAYEKLASHSWWGSCGREMIRIQRDSDWYTSQGIEDSLFNGYIYIYNMPDTDESTNRQHDRYIDTYMFKGYKLVGNGHTRPANTPQGENAKNGSYQNRFYQRIPYLKTVPYSDGYDPYN